MANVIEYSLRGKDDGASALLTSFAGKVGTVANIATAMGAALAAAGSAVYALSVSVAKVQTELQRTASRLNVSVEGLSKLQYVAQQTGIESGALTAALQRMSIQSAQAAQGNGDLSKVLTRLNVDVKEFVKLSPDAQLMKLSSSMTNVSSSAERMEIAFKVFGRGNVQMAELLAQSADETNRLGKEAEAVGAVVTAQAAANSTAFTKSYVAMKESVSDFGDTIAEAAIPYLTTLNKKITEIAVDLGPKIKSGMEAVVSALIGSFVFIKHAFTGLYKTIFTDEGIKNFVISIKDNFLLILQYASKIFPAIVQILWASFKTVVISVGELGKWVADKIKGFFTGADTPDFGDLLFKTIPQKAAETFAEVKNELTLLGDASKEFGKDFASNTFKGLNIDIQAVTDETNKLIESLKTIGDVKAPSKGGGPEGGTNEDEIKSHEEVKEAIYERKQTLLEMYQEGVDESMRFLESQIYFAEEFSTIWFDTITMLEFEIQNWAQVSSDAIRDTFNSVSVGIGNSVANAIVYGENLGTSLKNLLKGVIASIIQMYITLGIQRLIASAIGVSATKVEATANIAAKSAEVYANSFASASAIPYIGWLIAPGAAAANAEMVLSTAPMYGARGAAVGAGVAVAAHGGMDYVPKESTFLLDKGERVLSPRQNEDLTGFLNSPSSGGLVIQNLTIHVLENATNATALLEMRDYEIKEVVASKIIPALNALDKSGVRPNFVERQSR